MTRKPNLALNAEIESSGGAANGTGARGVLIGSAASIPIMHLTPFNQHRLTFCRPYFLTRDKNAKLIKQS
jgi:hypothetical protein